MHIDDHKPAEPAQVKYPCCKCEKDEPEDRVATYCFSIRSVISCYNTSYMNGHNKTTQSNEQFDHELGDVHTVYGGMQIGGLRNKEAWENLHTAGKRR